MLIAAAPDIFHVTPHYEGHAIVLARLAPLDAERLEAFFCAAGGGARRLRQSFEAAEGALPAD